MTAWSILHRRTLVSLTTTGMVWMIVSRCRRATHHSRVTLHNKRTRRLNLGMRTRRRLLVALPTHHRDIPRSRVTLHHRRATLHRLLQVGMAIRLLRWRSPSPPPR